MSTGRTESVADKCYSGRLPPLRYTELTSEQQVMWDALRAGPRGAKAIRSEGYLTGPFDALLRSPRIGGQLADLGASLRFASQIAPRMRELVIIMVAAHWHARFAWSSHLDYARDNGISDVVIEVVERGGHPELDAPDEQAAVDLVRELLSTGSVREDTYAEVRRYLDARACVELVALVGYYTLESFVLGMFDVSLPPGATAPWTSESVGENQEKNHAS